MISLRRSKTSDGTVIESLIHDKLCAFYEIWVNHVIGESSYRKIVGLRDTPPHPIDGITLENST
jgi:hypothetical protein